MKLETFIKEEALRIGFSHVGICAIEAGEKVSFLGEWLRKHYHGEMKWMENPRREDPSLVLPAARTMIVVGLNYRWPENISGKEQEGMISKYAWSGDYHEILKPMLQQLAGAISAQAGKHLFKAYVDTGPVVEKYWAQKAGIGWIGKHTNVLSERGSSWLFLGEIVTDLTLEPDASSVDHCGTCTSCIDACPTGAIVAPYVLDSRLCISYLTIELRGSIPRELRPLIGHRIFGCDDCQDVCPWNRFAFAGDPRFTPRPDILAATLAEYLQLTMDTFRQKFAGTNVLRPKYRGFIRNCLVAAGNARDPGLIPLIARHLASEDELIREHAAWALAQLRTSEAIEALRARYEVETSDTVRAEIEQSLNF